MTNLNLNNYSVRSMKAEDLGSVSLIFTEVFNSLGKSWSNQTSLQHIKDVFVSDTHWVTECDRKIVGFLMGNLLTTDNGTELFLDTIAVLPNYQNDGVGSDLWSEAEKYVQKNKLAGIRLFANPAFVSYHWYKKMGFRESGWVDLFKSNDSLLPLKG